MATVLWINLETGEISEEPVDGWEKIYKDPEEEEHAEDEDLSWLGDWYTRQLVDIEAERTALKVQYEANKKRLEARERYLEWAWGEKLQTYVEASLSGSRKKSMEFAFGTSGRRRVTETVITDEAKVITWAYENCKDAIKIAKPSILKSKLPKGEEIPGVARHTKDKFFVKPAKVLSSSSSEGNDTSPA